MNQPQLRDIHLPEPASWWPPAPGWWLSALAAALLVLALWWLWRRLRHKSLARLALDEFDRICAAHRAGQAPDATLQQVAHLLRRILISYRGRAVAGACTGDELARQIRALAPTVEFDQQQLELLARDRYRRERDCDIDGLLAASESWIRALPREKHHAAA